MGEFSFSVSVSVSLLPFFLKGNKHCSWVIAHQYGSYRSEKRHCLGGWCYQLIFGCPARRSGDWLLCLCLYELILHMCNLLLHGSCYPDLDAKTCRRRPLPYEPSCQHTTILNKCSLVISISHPYICQNVVLICISCTLQLTFEILSVDTRCLHPLCLLRSIPQAGSKETFLCACRITNTVIPSHLCKSSA